MPKTKIKTYWSEEIKRQNLSTNNLVVNELWNKQKCGGDA